MIFPAGVVSTVSTDGGGAAVTTAASRSGVGVDPAVMAPSESGGGTSVTTALADDGGVRWSLSFNIPCPEDRDG